MKYYDVYGCAAIDIQDNLVKMSPKGTGIVPVSMGLGTITDLDQSYMGSSIGFVVGKYEKVIYVCSRTTFEELSSAREFTSKLGEHSTFVVTSDGATTSTIEVYTLNRMQGGGSWTKQKTFQTDLDIKSKKFKQAVDRVIHSRSFTKKTGVMVLGGRGCYEMFKNEYKMFFFTQIKESYKGYNKTLRLLNGQYQREEPVYEDDSIELFTLTPK